MLHREPILTLRTLRWAGAALSIYLFLLLPSRLLAQGHELRVTLRDTDGQGLPGVAIIVRDEEGKELARQTTAEGGASSFAGLPAIVRVAVAGQLRGGPPLVQLGDDARGVRLALDQVATPPTLDLRVERDGLVLPDPATMLTLEMGGPVVNAAVPFATATLATPVPLATSAAGEASASVVVGTNQEEARPAASWVPLLSVLIIVVAAGVMLLIQRRRAAR